MFLNTFIMKMMRNTLVLCMPFCIPVGPGPRYEIITKMLPSCEVCTDKGPFPHRCYKDNYVTVIHGLQALKDR